ncbi:MAG: hypothetical protein IPO98_19160 [Saprospiraceae bacterium]|nr:hypothetical protein [Saprospiraceae bacterium]
MLSFFKSRGKEYVDAQAQPADGVTICVEWKDVHGLVIIKSLISAVKGNGSLPSLKDLSCLLLVHRSWLLKLANNLINRHVTNCRNRFITTTSHALDIGIKETVRFRKYGCYSSMAWTGF